jgi:hypothetical protein
MANFQRIVDGPLIKCPYTKQLSNNIIRQDLQPNSPRLLFYRGMQEDSEGNLYPLGSMDNLDYDGDQIPDRNLCLRWEGEYGLYNQLWKNYLSWYRSRRQIDYQVNDPSILNFTKLYMFDDIVIVLKKRTIQLTMDQELPSVCEFFIA